MSEEVVDPGPLARRLNEASARDGVTKRWAMDGKERTMWIFEPHVAESVFEALVAEHGITVHRDQWLDRESGVEMEDGQIRSIRMLSGQRFEGAMFIAVYVFFGAVFWFHP